MPMDTEVDEIVKELVAEQFELPRREVDLDMRIADVPDSIGFAVLIVTLEQRFGVTLDDTAVANGRTLRDIAEMIRVQLGAQRGGVSS
jgi:acyl carrier protein